MKNKWIGLILISVFVLCIFIFSYQRYTGAKNLEFKIALKALPDEISPRDNIINIYHYINIHLFYPLFSKSEGGLKSEFLDLEKTRSLSSDFNDFLLCLKSDGRFSNGERIEVDDLFDTLKSIHSRNVQLQKIRNIEQKKSCVQIVFDDPEPEYFHKLTTVDKTLLKKGTKNIGLGPYKLVNQDKQEILLEANEGLVEGDFKRVRFVKVSENDPDIFNYFDDWNYLWHHFDAKNYVPASIESRYLKIRRHLQKGLFLLIDIKDKKKRQHLVKCFNVSPLKSSLEESLVPIAGYLPKGLPGYNVDFEHIRSTLPGDCNRNKIDFTFYNFHPSKTEDLQKTIDANKKSFNVRLKNIDVKEAIKIVFEPFEKVMLIMADSPRTSVDGFLTIFFGKRPVVHPEFSELKEVVSKALLSKTAMDKRRYYEEAHRMLLESNYVLPLGQVMSTHYYRPELSNITLVDRMLGFPRIDMLKVNP